MQFRVSGVNFKNASSEELDKASLSERGMIARFKALKAEGVTQALILSTCNRVEEYSIIDSLKAVATSRDGLQPVQYFFAVVSGIESQVVGEDQILVQVKEAHQFSQYHGMMGKELDKIFRDAVTCAKAVKSEIDFGKVPPSICRRGLEMVNERKAVKGAKVFVIGSGRTAALAVELAHEMGAKEIAVTNRSPERVLALVERFGVRPVAFDARYEEIKESDIVISATKSPHVVLQRSNAVLGPGAPSGALPGIPGGPSLRTPGSSPACHAIFLDLARPRDIGNEYNPITLDDLGSTTGVPDEMMARAREIVREHAERTASWLGM